MLKKKQITKEHLDELKYEIEAYEDIAWIIMDELEITKLDDIPDSKYELVIYRARKIKNAREGN